MLGSDGQKKDKLELKEDANKGVYVKVLKTRRSGHNDKVAWWRVCGICRL